jgi:hypothetical protein
LDPHSYVRGVFTPALALDRITEYWIVDIQSKPSFGCLNPNRSICKAVASIETMCGPWLTIRLQPGCPYIGYGNCLLLYPPAIHNLPSMWYRLYVIKVATSPTELYVQGLLTPSAELCGMIGAKVCINAQLQPLRLSGPAMDNKGDRPNKRKRTDQIPFRGAHESDMANQGGKRFKRSSGVECNERKNANARATNRHNSGDETEVGDTKVQVKTEHDSDDETEEGDTQVETEHDPGDETEEGDTQVETEHDPGDETEVCDTQVETEHDSGDETEVCDTQVKTESDSDDETEEGDTQVETEHDSGDETEVGDTQVETEHDSGDETEVCDTKVQVKTETDSGDKTEVADEIAHKRKHPALAPSGGVGPIAALNEQTRADSIRETGANQISQQWEYKCILDTHTVHGVKHCLFEWELTWESDGALAIADYEYSKTGKTKMIHGITYHQIRWSNSWGLPTATI